MSLITSIFTGLAGFFEGHSASPNAPQLGADLRDLATRVEAELAPIVDTMVDEITAKLPFGTLWDPIADNMAAALVTKLIDKLPGPTQAAVTAAVAARPPCQVTMQPIAN